MTRKLLLFISIAILFLCASQITQAQLTPNYEWKMFETEHFRVIFHPEVENLAYEAAVAAEDSYQKWGELLQTTPPAKTDIVVIDVDDSPNGFADTASLTSWEFTAQAQMSSFFGGRIPSSMDGLLYHEFWHVADIYSVSGISGTLRSIFGTIILPNDVKPIWNIEGSATYSEFVEFGYSRASWAQSAMYMRQMALDDSFPSLDRAAGPFTNMGWPSIGTMWYLLGSWFTKYMQEEYGSDSVAKINDVHENSFLASLSYLLGDLLADHIGVEIYLAPDFGKTVESAIGVPIDELYLDFQAWLKSESDAHVARVNAEGATSSTKLTNLGYWTSQPKWSPNGDLIVYDHNDPFRRGGLRVVTPQGEDQFLTHAVVIFENGINWSPDGSQIVYSSYDQSGPYLTLNDLYLYDMESGISERLTEGARAYNPVFTKNGDSVLFVQQGPGDATSLARLDMKSKEIEVIQRFPEDTFLDFFDLSPDGSQLVMSVWKRPGYSDLFLMTVEGGELIQLTQDANEDFRPIWSPDGQYILFDSIRDETFNIFAMRVADREFFQVSNVISGAVSPSVAPDSSRIAFTGYGSEGYDIHWMDYDPSAWKAVSFAPESPQFWGGFPDLNVEIKSYNPYQTMTPKYWQPFVNQSSAGLRTDAWDALYRQYYYLDLGYDWEESAPFGSIFYINEEHVSPLSMAIGAGIDPYGNWQSLSVDMSVLTGFFRSHSMSLGIERSDYDGELHSAYVSSFYSETFGEDKYWNTLNTTATASVTHDPSSDQLYGDFVISIRDIAHLPFIDHAGPHEIAARAEVGVSNAEDNFGLGGSSGSFLLRGFPDGFFLGSQIASWSFEYRFPLISIEKGLGLIPLFIDDIRGALFIDGGMTWNEADIDDAESEIDPELPSHKIGIGAELQLLFTTGYWSQRSVRAGIAFPIGAEDTPVFYWGFGTAF